MKMRDLYPGAPEWATDAATTHVDIRLNWADRMRALLGGTIRVRVRTWTEHAPGQVASETSARVDTVSGRGRALAYRLGLRRPGYGEVQSEPSASS